jgi:hypothetical protein
MFISADQILAHLIGDYLLQSHWMATEKTKQSTAAAVHAVTYAIPFLFITLNPIALALIIAPHFLIDRYRLARYVVWLKNGYWRNEGEYIYGNFDVASATGYRDEVPAWLSVWLLIIADNTLHLISNGLALAIVR